MGRILACVGVVVVLVLASVPGVGLAADPPGSEIIYRVNAGGPQVGGSPIVWASDDPASAYLAAGGNGTFTPDAPLPSIDLSDGSVPAGTPEQLFLTERYDSPANPEMAWQFPVTNSSYRVRLYFAEIYDGITAAGQRVFDVSIEGALVVNDLDVFAQVGLNAGLVTEHDVSVSDGVLDIQFTHVVENPAVKAIEVVALDGGGPGDPPDPVDVGFGKSTLGGAGSLNNPTSLQFGPDDRLYVSQQNGLIRVYTVERNGANNYDVTNTENINLIQNITNHDDDGSVNNSVNNRLVTGILVQGTAQNPVLYVTSSDPRIGAGPSGTDLNLDTNSGIISRLTWNGSQWVKLDLVRGLPRSEENHTSNGLVLDSSTNTLYVTQGGNTNQGAPSNNFAELPEYALSAAILSVDLDAIGNSTYDLPTLNDEDRAGVNDSNDPFGGNDGKNQAILTSSGPVQVYAPGFRNPYDVIITEAGRMYSVDNGGNSGWGGLPVNEGPGGNCTNALSEPGQTEDDTLHLISGQGYYGGHPNPTRGNSSNTFNSNNQSPVAQVGENGIECENIPWQNRGVGVAWSQSTNGLTEYTTSNFGGAMDGDLITTSYNGVVHRVPINGTTGLPSGPSESLFTNVGSVPLDVIASSASDPFPGTVWVATYQGDDIVVFEPNDFGGGGQSCTGADSGNLDEDNDGFDNADEIDNGTNPCSAGDQPPDWDGDFTSDLNDPDDDNDGRPDTSDPFAIDPANGNSTSKPVLYTWENNAPSPGGLLGLGFTGLMTNGSSNYSSLFDPDKMTAGGAAGVLTVDAVPNGTALGSTNSQQYGFQLGVDLPTNSTSAARTRIGAPFAGLSPQSGQQMGLMFGTGTQDDYISIVVDGDGSVKVISEFNGVSSVGGAGTFSDDDGNIHEANIEYIAALGVTKGCNPPANTSYCPKDSVTRGQMAAFLRRALGLPFTNKDFFSDDNGTTFERDINAIAQAGITKGCNPPANTSYCPDGTVTRGQMAAFLVRGFGYTDNGGGDLFVDDDNSIFENDIDKLGTAGVTKGCNPPANDRYCPNDDVRRDAMASFLARAIQSAGGPPPVPTPSAPSAPSAPVNLSNLDAIDLRLVINPSTKRVTAQYATNTGSGFGSFKTVGSPVAFPSGWLTGPTAPAIGLISTSAGPAPAFPATWDFIEVS